MMRMVTNRTARARTGYAQRRRYKQRRAGVSHAARRVPSRKCIVTGESLPVDRLIRFVISPDVMVVPDLKHKLEGRGVWVTATKTCVNEAAAKNLFARGFRKKVEVTDDLAGMIDGMIETSCLNALGMARKAGKIVLGQTKVEAAARHKPLGLVFHAQDGSADGRRKILGALLGAGINDRVEVIDCFTSTQLSLAIGMPNVVHAAVSVGGMAVAIAANCRNLLRFRGIETSGLAAGSSISRQVGPDNLVDVPSKDVRTV